MTFKNNYVKHKNCIDAFFVPLDVIHDDGNTAIVKGNWMVQGIFSYWVASNTERLFIKTDQYSNWGAYEPTGKLYLTGWK